MATAGNGRRRNGGNGDAGSVPRWVRTLFDLHERRMEAIERTIEEIRASRAEDKARHERRMAVLEADARRSEIRVEEMRRQTREIILEISRLDAERKKETAERKRETADRKRETAERKAEAARIDAERKAEAARIDSERKAEAAKLDSERKVEAARNLAEHVEFMSALKEIRDSLSSR